VDPVEAQEYYREAALRAERYLKIRPDDAQGFAQLAWYSANLGDKTKARDMQGKAEALATERARSRCGARRRWRYWTMPKRRAEQMARVVRRGNSAAADRIDSRAAAIERESRPCPSLRRSSDSTTIKD
jgi:hypothetical protein